MIAAIVATILIALILLGFTVPILEAIYAIIQGIREALKRR